MIWNKWLEINSNTFLKLIVILDVLIIPKFFFFKIFI
jgi:hypothetical protein